MPKTRRHRRADPFWRDTIAAWKESGQTVAAFCAARGIGESTFFAKRRQLVRRKRSPNAPTSPTPGPSFAAVRVTPDPTVEFVIPSGPWAYLRHLLTELPARAAGADHADLLPDL